MHRTQPLPIRAVGAGTAAAVAMVLTACAAPATDHDALFSFDRSPSDQGVAGDVRAEAISEISDLITADGGLGVTFTASSFGGGPADLASTGTVDLQCLDDARQCSDPIVVRERVESAAALIDLALATEPSVTGSDPIGALHRLVADAARQADGVLSVHVWTDLYSRSDTLDMPATDVSTEAARRAVVGQLAGRGLSFGGLGLDEDDSITVHLIPAEAAMVSSGYFEQLVRFAEQLLAPSEATVRVVASKGALDAG